MLTVGKKLGNWDHRMDDGMDDALEIESGSLGALKARGVPFLQADARGSVIPTS